VKLGALVLTVLCYNVRGLPGWIAGDDPAGRMAQISKHIAAYDVALVQESWTNFALLRAGAAHAVIERDGRADAGSRSESGLAAFARARLRAVSRGSLGACAGWYDRANDCLADKGFLRLRLALANGAELDVWTTHLDAGRDETDRAARDEQLQRLTERVRALSAGAALIVAGDLNLDYENAADRALLDRFTRELSLSDTGARPDADGAFAHKRIDYVLFRSGAGAVLELEAAGEAREFADGPTPLSDHPALFARFRISNAASAP